MRAGGDMLCCVPKKCPDSPPPPPTQPPPAALEAEKEPPPSTCVAPPPPQPPQVEEKQEDESGPGARDRLRESRRRFFREGETHAAPPLPPVSQDALTYIHTHHSHTLSLQYSKELSGVLFIQFHFRWASPRRFSVLNEFCLCAIFRL